MAPDPGSEYTVRCALGKAVLESSHLNTIRDAIARVHRCTYHATELLNLYVRDRIENHGGAGLDQIFSNNWMVNAYQAVSIGTGGKAAKVDPSVQSVFDTHMKDTFDRQARTGLTQALTYECINLAAVGSTNVWMHFRKRVLAYVRTHHAIDEEAYKALTNDQRRARKLALLQVAEDLCRNPSESCLSPAEYHAWIASERARLGIDTAVGEWGDKPLLYHLKAKPHRFLVAMHAMSVATHAAGRKAFALFPLRRSHVPGHVRFDRKVLDDLLHLGCAYAASKAKKAKKANGGVDLNSQPLTDSGRAPKRKRDDPSLIEEKAEVFHQVLDLRAAGVHRRHHFAFAFTTDGVSLHLNMQVPGKKATTKKAKSKAGKLAVMPVRGVHSIDALKHAARLDQMHVIGIDPGKRELIVAVDRDDPKNAPVVRYTLDQRRRDMRTRQYADEVTRSRPFTVTAAEEDLSLFNSKAPSLAEFARFGAERRRQLREVAEIHAFYDDLEHRNRRRKTALKAQQSEARLYNRLRGMHDPSDGRTLVLAYGAWGLVAGRPNAAANKGNPPAIGAGLMNKLSKHFVVAPTPEHYTSKTCVACGGLCGPHPTLKTKHNNKNIRGLRVCQHEGCGLLQNRDKTGATNIGLQFQKLLRGEPPLRAMSDEEVEFHRLNACLECHDS
jgi:hypothetical protein